MAFRYKINTDLPDFKKLKPTAEQLAKIGEEITAKIIKRTQLGFGVIDDETNQVSLNSLKKLSGKYIKFRKRYSRFLDGTTTASRNNATLTGQLVKSIVSSVKSPLQVTWNVSGRRSSVKPIYKPRNGSRSNLQVLDHYEKQGRKFLGLTKTEKNSFISMLRKVALSKIR